MPNLDDDGTIKLDGNAARELAKTLMSYAYHLERWESAARGDDLVLVTRKDGAIWVTWRRRTVLMRLSKLRRAQSCTHCTQKAMALWVQAQTYLYDAVSVGGTRFHHARVCEPCVDTLASATTDLREVVGSSP